MLHSSVPGIGLFGWLVEFGWLVYGCLVGFGWLASLVGWLVGLWFFVCLLAFLLVGLFVCLFVYV